MKPAGVTGTRRALLGTEAAVRAEFVEAGGGDAEAALDHAAIRLRMAQAEESRLLELVGRLRLTNQRLQFPQIYPPNSPVGAEQLAEVIYGVAARIVELMEREGMQDDYDETYNSMVAIARLGQLADAA